jgi:hypothetical protein
MQIIHKHEKVPWQREISSMIFTLIEQKPVKNWTFDLKKYIECLPRYESTLNINVLEQANLTFWQSKLLEGLN